MKRVLVVEDDASIRLLVCKFLESAGIASVCATDGTEALDRISRESFDLALLDLGLPGVHGLEILKRLQEEGSRLKVIVMTGDDAPETILQAVRRRACRYVLKPLDMKSLMDVVQDELADENPHEPIEVVSALPEWIELLVPCDLTSADRIQSVMRQMEADLPEHVRDSIGRAFRELLMNAMEWGGKLNPSHKVRISYLRARRMLMYRIADPGPGFNLESLPHSALGNPQDRPLEHFEVRRELGLRPGGFGILLAQSLVDELIYNEAHNEVVLVKYLD